MRIRWRALLLLTTLMSWRVSADDLLSRDVLDMFAEVLDRGYYGLRDEETAAFIIRDGNDRCVLWPATDEYHATRYRWPPPRGIVAIVHTHPLAMPRPSTADRATAIRLGIPVYSITLTSIYRADIFGIETSIVRGRRWFHDQNSQRGLCAFESRALQPTPPVKVERAAAVAPE